MDRKVWPCHDPGMDLDEVRRALSKRGAFSSKRVAFFVIAGLCIVVGILLRSGQYFGQPKVEQSAPVVVPAPPPPAAATSAMPQTPPPAAATSAVPQTPPPAQETATAPDAQAEHTGAEVEQAGAVEHAEQPEPQGSGRILVSKQPVAVLASPSSSAPTLYGFPAGRPFRVIGRDGGFAQSRTRGAVRVAGSMRPRSRFRRACRLSRRRLSRGLPQSVESLQIPPPRSQERQRRTARSLTTPGRPLKTTQPKRTSDPAYLAEGVSSGASSETATSLERCPLSAKSRHVRRDWLFGATLAV
jgi:hypothetical protein